MKKQIHLNENELYSLIKESVKKVLNEGKKVNHKPYFNNKGTTSYKGSVEKWYKPGERVKWGSQDFIDNADELRKYIPDQQSFDEMLTVFKDAVKHNNRAENYDKNGNFVTDPLADVKGNKRERAKIADMLRINGITLDEYRKMTEKEQDECWDEYDHYYSPRAIRHREWEEMGDPDWDMIYDNLPYN